jgi:WhiB family transcriptional regulator, redox-sensing transcriptional regulator
MTQCATVTALPTGRATPNCKAPDANPEDWFPHEPQADRPTERAAYEQTARQLCAGCPIAVECLEKELLVAGTHGVFGGTAPWERRAMRRNALRRANRMAVAS